MLKRDARKKNLIKRSSENGYTTLINCYQKICSGGCCLLAQLAQKRLERENKAEIRMRQ
jgi:hypothetical protein